METVFVESKIHPLNPFMDYCRTLLSNDGAIPDVGIFFEGIENLRKGPLKEEYETVGEKSNPIIFHTFRLTIYYGHN